MYELLTKNGDSVTRKHAKSMDDAIRIFSIIKVLDKELLLKIYDVVYTG